jgi:hypothetical protein
LDSDRFDAFTRTLSSRRTALGGLVGGIAALLGVTSPEETTAHNYLASCRRKRDPVLRQRCLQMAREHNRKHRTCRSITLREACRAKDCGVVRDACGKRRNCGPCSSHQACLSNNTCATQCTGSPCIGDTQFYCPPGCVCSREFEAGTGVLHCLNAADPNYTCTISNPTYCATTRDCRVGDKCEPVPCGPGGALERRCVATCSAPVFSCRRYGESCQTSGDCCCNVPCSGGLCRFP